MTDRYDPHRAHPDTVLAILQRLLAPNGAPLPYPGFWELRDGLREQCRVRTQAEVAIDLAGKLGASAYGRTPGDETRGVCFNLPDGVTIKDVLDLVVEFGYAAPADSGPPGAAAKESREDIAAPGGATTEGDPVAPEPGERPCGCEQTEELEKQLAALRARNFELAMVLSRVRKLINEPWKP